MVKAGGREKGLNSSGIVSIYLPRRREADVTARREERRENSIYVRTADAGDGVGALVVVVAMDSG